MRKVYYSLVLMLTILPMFCMAQNNSTTFEREFVYLFEESEIPLDVNVSFKGYVDAVGNEVYHGSFVAKGYDSRSANGAAGTFQFNASGNYVDGKLDGAFSVKFTQNFTRPQKIAMTGELKASFSKGVPTGTWSISKVYTMSGKTENNLCTVTFVDGKLKTIKRGNEYLTLNDDGSASCDWNGKVFKNNISTQKYYTISNGEVKVNSVVLDIINQYTSGKLTKSDLTKKGYGLKKMQGSIEGIVDLVKDVLAPTYFSEEENFCMRTFYKDFNIKNYVAENVSFDEYMLCQIKLSSAEQVKEKLANELADVSNNDELAGLKEMVLNNHINNVIFFTDEVKEVALQLVTVKEKELERKNELEEEVAAKAKAISAIDNELGAMFNKLNANDTRYQRDTVYLHMLLECGNKMVDAYHFKSYRDSLMYIIKNNNPVLNKEIGKLKSVPDLNIVQIIEMESNAKSSLRKKLDLYSKLNSLYELLKKNDATLSALTDAHATASVQAYMSYFTKATKPLNKSIISNMELMQDVLAKQDTCLSFINRLANVESKASTITNSALAGVIKVYQGYIKNYNLVWTPDASVQTLIEVEKTQDNCIEFINELKVVNENNTSLTEKASAYSDIAKAYQSYFKGLDLVWAPGKSSQGLKDIQKEQENLVSFITERAKVEANTATVTEKAGKNKNILKAYQTYMKSANVAWTAGVKVQQLLDIQSIQEVFINALNSANVKDIDTNLKKNKDKSFDSVLNILKN